ncbi:hypothetical protein Q5P01_002922 [Channa striata]|uniref:G-protein coupled receptors family 1 profile domain-containing protein n=1 Tax=Channa striata TaxID=64152 RepID=A0AA88T8K1_CHASR|nr:hypothetical protein Q5P01_002922 [Channa striata]
MTDNSSFNSLSLLPLYPSNFSYEISTSPCFRSEISICIFSVLFIINLLLLPLFIFVLCVGYRQWRQQRSTSTTHSNLFIYHSIAMELNVFFGFTSFYCGGYFNVPGIMLIGLIIWTITYLGQGLLHILTCVERYLAVVYPISYLHLRQAGEVTIRNISVGCVWLLTFAWLLMCYLLSSNLYFILHCCCTMFVFVVITFCSISVLCALKRPGPGEVGGNKKRIDQSKQRAFVNILLITGVLLLRYVGKMICFMIFNLTEVEPSNICVALLATVCLDLPSSLVLPLLFLQRVGKLQCCKPNSES